MADESQRIGENKMMSKEIISFAATPDKSAQKPAPLVPTVVEESAGTGLSRPM